MDHVLNHAKQTTGEAPRLSPLEAFVAWLTNFLRIIAGLKRRTVFPPNWKDHWPGLRELEWYRDQILAFSAKHVLSGGSLDDRTDFQLITEVPADYGICPQTPQAMNRRFIAMAQFRLDPDKYIQRHIRRIAKRAGIQLLISPSGCPLRLASLNTSPNAPHWRRKATALFPPSREARGRWRASSRDGGGSRRPALTAQARAPPDRPLPIACCLAGHASETAPSHPLTSRAVCTKYPASNGGTHMKSAKHA